MERVETLCKLLEDKIRKKASLNDLLTTVKMLESELIHLKNITPPAQTQIDTNGSSLFIAKQFDSEIASEETVETEPEKIIEVLQIDEEEIEAELEEIKKQADERNNAGRSHKPTPSYNLFEDVPTMAGRQIDYKTAGVKKEINETIPVNTATSLNEMLRKPQMEISDNLQDTPVKDLKKAIGINDRFKYLNELFKGDEVVYERSIKTINNFAIYPEAEYWIRRELKLKYAWDDKHETVQQFDQLVRRRFA